jgi:zinc transporter ZupT
MERVAAFIIGLVIAAVLFRDGQKHQDPMMMFFAAAAAGAGIFIAVQYG